MLFLVLRKKRNIYNQQIEEIDKSKKRASDWNREMGLLGVFKGLC